MVPQRAPITESVVIARLAARRTAIVLCAAVMGLFAIAFAASVATIRLSHSRATLQ
jgi:hypothetical protein